MKENQLVWKRMSLYEIKWACVKVRVNPLLLTRLAKPHPANARQTTWTQRHPGILHHSSLQLHRACPGQGVWSGHFGRDHFQLHKEVEELFLYSNSDYYLPQKYLESEVLQRRRKEGARFSATRSPIPSHIFLVFTTSNSDFLGQRTCSTCGSILKSTRRRWSSSWNAQWALLRRRKR